MIPRAIRDLLEGVDLPTLYEIRDLMAELISEKEPVKGDIATLSDQNSNREVLEERHSETMTYRLERVSCGKNCKGCPHGPYWYGYWREGGRTRSKYIGKNLTFYRAKKV